MVKENNMKKWMISIYGKKSSIVKENNMKNIDDFVSRGIKFLASILKMKIVIYELLFFTIL
jgi:hypothetical protein